MLDSELFKLGEIRGTFVSDGDLGPARLEWHIPAPMAPVNALVAACLITPHHEKAMTQYPCLIMTRLGTSCRLTFTILTLRLLK